MWGCAVILSGLLALSSAHEVKLTPPKKALTPYFNLEVVYSPNTSLIGWWVTTPDYGSYLTITPNYTERSTFYRSIDWKNPEHPLGGSVLVRNVTDAVPYNVPGTPYTPRNLIAGQTGCLTCNDGSGLPIVASVFTKSQLDWDEFGSSELDFRTDLSGGVYFNQAQAGSLTGWTKTSNCWFNVYGSTLSRFVVTDKYYPDQCSELQLRWVFADL